MGLYELTKTKRINIMADKVRPIYQANFLGAAPTYSGVCLLTIKRPIINVGANLGFIITLIAKSVKKKVITYFIIMKLPLKRMNIKDKNVNKKSIPAEALISRSFKTGML